MFSSTGWLFFLLVAGKSYAFVHVFYIVCYISSFKTSACVGGVTQKQWLYITHDKTLGADVVSGVAHLGEEEDPLIVENEPFSGRWKPPSCRAEQCPPSLAGNLPDRGKLCHKTGFISFGCLSLCLVEQGMQWETRNRPGLLRTSCSWLSEMSLRLLLVRLRHKVVLKSSGI